MAAVTTQALVVVRGGFPVCGAWGVLRGLCLARERCVTATALERACLVTQKGQPCSETEGLLPAHGNCIFPRELRFLQLSPFDTGGRFPTGASGSLGDAARVATGEDWLPCRLLHG